MRRGDPRLGRSLALPLGVREPLGFDGKIGGEEFWLLSDSLAQRDAAVARVSVWFDLRSDEREELEKVILGEVPGLTSDEVAAAAGVTVEQARRLWRALGFPDAGEQAAFTAADLNALSTLVGAVEAGAIDFDTAVRLTRAVGQTMARLADWQVATLSARVEHLEAGEEATGSRIGSALRLADQVGVPFETLLIYSWRRHLAAVRASRPTRRGARSSPALFRLWLGLRLWRCAVLG